MPKTASTYGASSALVRQAILFRLISALLIATMYGLIKGMGASYPIGQIIFVRNLFALIPIIGLVCYLGEWKTLRIKEPGAHALRSIFGTASQFFSFAAVGMLPLATATALNNTAPLFIGLFAIVFLKEPANTGKWLALLLGFVGAYLIVLPDMTWRVETGVLVALLGAIATAAALISIRSMPGTESGTAIAFYFTLFGTFVGAVSLLFDGVTPPMRDLPALVAIGLLGGVAQVLLTFAYQNAPASVIAPFEYATLIFATLISFLFWNECPGINELLGIAVIIGATTLLTLNNRRRG